jgi:hypothetical protein
MSWRCGRTGWPAGLPASKPNLQGGGHEAHTARSKREVDTVAIPNRAHEAEASRGLGNPKRAEVRKRAFGKPQ